MVSWLLNVGYLVLLLAASPLLLWSAIRRGKYREGWAAKWLGRVPPREGGRPCIWLHAVSVGEVNLLAPVLERLERQRPDLQCVISTTTRTGYELACAKYAPRTVFYCPLDFSWAVQQAMRRIRPHLLVLAELELWPNLIRAARAHGARVAIINGRLSEASHRGYRRIGPLVRWMLRQVDLVAVQSDEYAARFWELGARPAVVHRTGSVKFDGAETARDNPRTRRLAELAGFSDEDVVLLAGSTQEPEERLALEAFRTLALEFPQLRLVLVPRHAERFESVARMLDEEGVAWHRRSQLEGTGAGARGPTADSPAARHVRILLVDAIGELGGWWGTAQIAFVGGSMGSRGGQNMIEPAAYGAAVSFGPHTKNFRDVVAMLLSAEAARVVHDGAELTAFVRRCLVEPDWAERMGRRARDLVLQQRGAADATVRLLLDLLETSAADRT